MSLRKSPRMTPALLQALRLNARKSTGPRTAQGKSQSRMNALRSGRYSPVYKQLSEAIEDAGVGHVQAAAASVLSPAEVRHPVFRRAVREALEIDHDVLMSFRLNKGPLISLDLLPPLPPASFPRRRESSRWELGPRLRGDDSKMARRSATKHSKARMTQMRNRSRYVDESSGPVLDDPTMFKKTKGREGPAKKITVF